MEYREIYLAFLDILGFKNLILNNGFESLNDIFQDFIDIIPMSVNLISRSTGELNTVVNFNLFSDTVALWTNNNSFKSFFHLVQVISNLLNYSVQIGMPLRGAISSGSLLNNAFSIKSDKVNIVNTILGDAIVNANKLETKQEWSGCIIDPDLENSENEAIRNFLKEHQLVKYYVRYNVPLKSDGYRSMLTVNWINLENDVLSEEKIRESFDAFNKKSSDSEVEVKIENTINYYKYVKALPSFQ